MNSDNFSVDIKTVRGYASAIKVGIFLVYLAGALFATIMFTQVIDSLFPDSLILSFLAHVGAWANFASVLLMLVAKDYWIHGKTMMWTAVGFWIAEVAMMVGNTLLAYGSSWATAWAGLAPAAPVLVIIIWGVLWLMHPDHKARQSSMQFYYDAQTDLQSKMRRSLDSPDVQKILDAGAQQAAIQTVEKTLNVLIDPNHQRTVALPSNGHNKEPIMEPQNGNPMKR